LPGMCFPGFPRYAKRCLGVQITPEFFIALLYPKAVDPAALLTTPPKGGAAAPLPSPLIN